MQENIFKKLETKETIDEEVKKDLLADIESSKLFLDLSELFGMKFGDVISDFFN